MQNRTSTAETRFSTARPRTRTSWLIVPDRREAAHHAEVVPLCTYETIFNVFPNISILFCEERSVGVVLGSVLGVNARQETSIKGVVEHETVLVSIIVITTLQSIVNILCVLGCA